MSMINLWDETIEMLSLNGKIWEDVKFIQGNDFRISMDNFKEVALITNYEDGAGIQHIATDIKIIGDGWCMIREDYDEWNFISTVPLENIKRVDSLGDDTIMWDTLKEINNKEENN